MHVLLSGMGSGSFGSLTGVSKLFCAGCSGIWWWLFEDVYMAVLWLIAAWRLVV